MPTLPAALDAPRHETSGKAGPLSYYVGGDGPPMLLIHSINAAGSAYEIRPIFEAMVETYRVYAPDLPGFGFSDRSDRDYAPRLMTDALHDMLGVIAEDTGTTPVDALALSLSSEFLARATIETPDRFRTLAFITPTGFSNRSAHLGRTRTTREVPGLYAFLTFPLWSNALFAALTSQASIRFFLRKTFGSDDFDEGLAQYDYLTTHQRGAKYAPYAFVSGKLFSVDVRELYAQLELPVWMTTASKGDFANFSNPSWAKGQPNWDVKEFDTGALPQFERPEAFCTAYSAFLQA
jgi:pimeloyl-ACP methyl ester carboxylesterase